MQAWADSGAKETAVDEGRFIKLLPILGSLGTETSDSSHTLVYISSQLLIADRPFSLILPLVLGWWRSRRWRERKS